MFSSLVTATKTRYATLRGGDEADGDTEDDSHISRVLRNYYTEQGRPFPPWLGGGPQAQQNRPGQTQGGGINLRRGANNSTGINTPAQGVKNTLSDIWDKPQQSQQQQPVSPGNQSSAGQQGAAGMNKMRFFRRDPSSQQQQGGGYEQDIPPNNTAQSSIRDRLWSNRGGTPGGGRTPPPQQQYQAPPPSQQSYGSNQHGGRYGARDKSPARAPQQQYQPQSSSGNGYKPYVSASSPWQTDEPAYGGGGGGYGSGGTSGGYVGGVAAARKGPPAAGGRIGLPTGPKMMK